MCYSKSYAVEVFRLFFETHPRKGEWVFDFRGSKLIVVVLT